MLVSSPTPPDGVFPPTNPRMVLPDGAQQPLGCRYDGTDPTGAHRWVVGEGLVTVEGATLAADWWPAGAVIHLGLTPPAPPLSEPEPTPVAQPALGKQPRKRRNV